MSRSMESVSLENVLFPVSRVSLRRSDTGEALHRHWAIVPDNENVVFAVVTQSYELVSNEEACGLGSKAFTLIFGEEAVSELRPFNVIMPKTRSWVQIDFTADNLAFEPYEGDRWVPFLRVTNSYNRTKALQFAVGVCRWICTNGIIFGEQSLTLRNTHQKGVDLHAMLARAFAMGGAQFNLPRVKDSISRLTSLHVAENLFLAGMLEILCIGVPNEIPPTPLQAAGWPELGPHLSELGRRYVEQLGENAYALVNAESDYASDITAPRMNPTLVNSRQSRCGHWAEDVVRQYRESAVRIKFRPENLDAARRLLNFATQGDA